MMRESEKALGSSDAPDSCPLQYARLIERERMSIGGIVGWTIFGLLVLIFATSAIFEFLPRSYCHPQSKRVASAANLRQIGLGMLMYYNGYTRFPDSFSTLLATEDLTPKVFVSPSGNDTPATGSTIQAVLADFAKPGHCSYMYFGASLSPNADPTTVVACEAPRPGAAGMNVLFLDGRVDFITNPAAQQLRAALAAGPAAWSSASGITWPATQRTIMP